MTLSIKHSTHLAFLGLRSLWPESIGGDCKTCGSQVGVLAAAALVGLKETPPLLAQDHENAKLLAAGGEENKIKKSF